MLQYLQIGIFEKNCSNYRLEIMEKIENFDSLKDFLAQMDDNIAIIDGNIPVDIQMKYYEFLGKIVEKLDKDETEAHAKDLYSEEVSVEEKKKLLISLASFDDVRFFRLIEEYNKKPNKALKHWSNMAYQHAKINLENSFLPNKKVLISTGLGGKENKLRYFVVLMKDDRETPFTDTQKKVIKNETEIVFKDNEVDMEEINFTHNYLSIQILVAIKIPVQSVFLDVIANCNELGHFMSEHFIVTNVKVLEQKEIEDILNKKEK